MGVILYSHGNKTHFHNKGCALGVILEETVFGTQKWSIDHSIFSLLGAGGGEGHLEVLFLVVFLCQVAGTHKTTMFMKKGELQPHHCLRSGHLLDMTVKWPIQPCCVKFL